MKKNKGGRPTAYKGSYAEQAYKYCLLGATDAQLATFFEVAESTINNWKRDHPEFLESVTRGKTVADANVAEAFYKRATGFEKEDSEKVFQYQGEIVRATTKEYFPPDPGAALNWLKNRQPDKWRDKQNLDVTTKGDSMHERANYDLSKLTFDELKTLKALKEKLGEPLPAENTHQVVFHNYSQPKD